jgi:hypothetical protein
MKVGMNAFFQLQTGGLSEFLFFPEDILELQNHLILLDTLCRSSSGVVFRSKNIKHVSFSLFSYITRSAYALNLEVWCIWCVSRTTVSYQSRD